MRKLLAVVVLLVALSMPVIAGRVTGGGEYCPVVDCVTCVDESCPDTNSITPIGKSGRTSPGATDSLTPGLMLFALALLIVFKLRS